MFPFWMSSVCHFGHEGGNFGPERERWAAREMRLLKSQSPGRTSGMARSLIAVACVLGVLANGAALLTVQPIDTPHWSRLTSHKEFANVNEVTGSPSDWISTICKPLFRFPEGGVSYQFPNTEFYLPAATYSAVCQARDLAYTKVSDPILLIARFPSEDPMQLDLEIEEFEWYCFAVDRNEMVVFATRLSDTITNQDTGLGESPLLAPLKKFGFNVYSDPGE
jgi:hypothetical protein